MHSQASDVRREHNAQHFLLMKHIRERGALGVCVCWNGVLQKRVSEYEWQWNCYGYERCLLSATEIQFSEIICNNKVSCVLCASYCYAVLTPCHHLLILFSAIIRTGIKGAGRGNACTSTWLLLQKMYLLLDIHSKSEQRNGITSSRVRHSANQEVLVLLNFEIALAKQ